MKKILVLAACLALLTAGAAQAALLQVGSSYSGSTTDTIIHMLSPTSVATNEGGGSIDVSYLDGERLQYLYCVDIDRDVYVNNSYNTTVVNTGGNIYGSPLNNANQVAWLLTNYGTAGQTAQAQALQAKIWEVVETGWTFNAAAYSAGDATLNWYNTIDSAFDAALLADPNMGSSMVGNFYWITPGRDVAINGLYVFQGLVAPTPIPGTVLLMGSGLAGLVGIARFRRKRSAN